MSGDLTVEATGETVSEAKWRALRELEMLAPALDRAAVRFEVVSEGHRGLLGVGYAPARVVATAPAAAIATAAEDRGDESDDARVVRELLERVTAAIGLRCRIEITESGLSLTATCLGDDLGRLIGRHGQTIDAIQLLAATMLARGAEERREIVVDAAGYRDRRRRALESIAQRAAGEALRTGTEVELEPMTAAERKLVHTFLADRDDVSTGSEGDEPHRRVVVEPRV